MDQYINHPEVQDLLKIVRQTGLDKKAYSDIIDSGGYQYVDLVQEGGGVLGIALLGYTYIMEQAGIRFFSLAGSSAGAINSMMMAGMGKVGEAVSLKTLEMLSSKNLFEIVDGDRRLWNLLQRFLDNKNWKYSLLVWNIRRIRKALMHNLGLNPGDDFLNWIDKTLQDNGIRTLADLRHHRRQLPDLFERHTGKKINREAGLKIITSDITSKSKITFPEMAELYWEEPDAVNLSLFVRASMSIPFFFEPLVVKNIPNSGTSEDPKLPRDQTRWHKHTGYRGIIPKTVHFVDGGMLSNFPINVFHSKGVPTKPTFGAKLSTWRTEAQEVKSIGNYCGAMISTMRQLHDYDFLLKNTDYKQLICSINCDAQLDENGNRKFNVLDFDMQAETKRELFRHGASKAVEFLAAFNWEHYKNTRKQLIQGAEQPATRNQ
jgi:NTE family protein